jgi:thiosulfate/3-mercaptopyruvate sulfurtransferase
MNQARRQVLKGLLLAPTLALLSSCGSSFDEPVVGGTTSTPPNGAAAVISAEKAARLILSRRVLVLAAESKAESGPLQLLGGAVPVDVDQLTTFSEQPGALLDPLAFGQLFRAWGVDSTTPIFIYDDGAAKFAARVHFLLLHFGAAPSFIVNGGEQELRKFVSAGVGVAVPSQFNAQVVNEPIQLVFQEEVLARLGGTTQIIDVRTPAEYNGELLLPGDARPGHIPGAINLPEGEFFDSNGLILETPALLELFRSRGIVESRPVLAYCHDGAKSSLAATLLVQSGYPDVSLYYLSYKDWSENPSLPVEL